MLQFLNPPGTTWKWVVSRKLDHSSDKGWVGWGTWYPLGRTARTGPGSVLYTAKKLKMSFPSVF